MFASAWPKKAFVEYVSTLKRYLKFFQNLSKKKNSLI